MDFLERLHIIHSYTGLFHTLTAVLSLIFGTAVLLNRKGTLKHKRMGRVYGVSMLLMILSSFAIYNFGGFSLFHGFALVSFVTLLAGMIPVLRKKRSDWYSQHYYSMSWSVVGLYCAFWAELGVRFFDMRYFWWVVMIATGLTAALGSFYIRKEAAKLKFD